MKKILLSLIIAVTAITTSNAQVRQKLPPLKLYSSYLTVLQELMSDGWRVVTEQKGTSYDETVVYFFSASRNENLTCIFINKELSSVSRTVPIEEGELIETELLKELKLESAKAWTRQTLFGTTYLKMYTDKRTGEIWTFARTPSKKCVFGIETTDCLSRELKGYKPPSE